nr:class I SAM-dependent methyltransferase [Bacillus gaemokensis]
MLQKAKEKYPDNQVKFFHMDAQNPQFDIVVASLILSVIPDPKKVMREMIRVSKPKGHIVIFDKFAPED